MAHALFKPLLMTSITASSILSGCLFSLSYVSTAAILSSPSVDEGHMLTTWRVVFNRGFHLCPPNAVFSGLCCFINAYLIRKYGSGSGGLGQGSSSRVYSLLVAGLCMIGIVPFTLSRIVPLEEVLLRKESRLAKIRQSVAKIDHGVSGNADGENKGSCAETRQLLERWVGLNYVRTTLPFAGVLVAWSVW